MQDLEDNLFEAQFTFDESWGPNPGGVKSLRNNVLKGLSQVIADNYEFQRIQGKHNQAHYKMRLYVFSEEEIKELLS